MSIRELNHQDIGIASQLSEIMQLAYQEEAQLIGAENFPPLRRTETDIQRSSGTFFACEDKGETVGAIELEINGDGVQIASLVVHPQKTRRGFGAKLVEHALELAKDRTVLVQTARDNNIAIGLYEKLGFELVRQFSTDEGYELVELIK